MARIRRNDIILLFLVVAAIYLYAENLGKFLGFASQSSDNDSENTDSENVSENSASENNETEMHLTRKLLSHEDDAFEDLLESIPGLKLVQSRMHTNDEEAIKEPILGTKIRFRNLRQKRDTPINDNYAWKLHLNVTKHGEIFDMSVLAEDLQTRTKNRKDNYLDMALYLEGGERDDSYEELHQAWDSLGPFLKKLYKKNINDLNKIHDNVDTEVVITEEPTEASRSMQTVDKGREPKFLFGLLNFGGNSENPPFEEGSGSSLEKEVSTQDNNIPAGVTNVNSGNVMNSTVAPLDTNSPTGMELLGTLELVSKESTIIKTGFEGELNLTEDLSNSNFQTDMPKTEVESLGTPELASKESTIIKTGFEGELNLTEDLSNSNFQTDMPKTEVESLGTPELASKESTIIKTGFEGELNLTEDLSNSNFQTDMPKTEVESLGTPELASKESTIIKTGFEGELNLTEDLSNSNFQTDMPKTEVESLGTPELASKESTIIKTGFEGELNLTEDLSNSNFQTDMPKTEVESLGTPELASKESTIIKTSFEDGLNLTEDLSNANFQTDIPMTVVESFSVPEPISKVVGVTPDISDPISNEPKFTRSSMENELSLTTYDLKLNPRIGMMPETESFIVESTTLVPTNEKFDFLQDLSSDSNLETSTDLVERTSLFDLPFAATTIEPESPFTSEQLREFCVRLMGGIGKSSRSVDESSKFDGSGDLDSLEEKEGKISTDVPSILPEVSTEVTVKPNSQRVGLFANLWNRLTGGRFRRLNQDIDMTMDIGDDSFISEEKGMFQSLSSTESGSNQNVENLITEDDSALTVLDCETFFNIMKRDPIFTKPNLLDILINPHLLNIDTDEFNFTEIKDKQMRFLSEGPDSEESEVEAITLLPISEKELRNFHLLSTEVANDGFSDEFLIQKEAITESTNKIFKDLFSDSPLTSSDVASSIAQESFDSGTMDKSKIGNLMKEKENSETSFTERSSALLNEQISTQVTPEVKKPLSQSNFDTTTEKFLEASTKIDSRIFSWLNRGSGNAEIQQLNKLSTQKMDEIEEASFHPDLINFGSGDGEFTDRFSIDEQHTTTDSNIKPRVLGKCSDLRMTSVKEK
ncbi:uncharacterized protein CEXT_506751 [Caerostris extrusa]|uniref:Uncharacterized protein n=1 Tax=Caerostris extrusa TaxID=172846 RepID=A0AAV4VA31_CAEEX|nr:uncharacterized protein CEXT_506751 [Caerostris extrusa]